MAIKARTAADLPRRAGRVPWTIFHTIARVRPCRRARSAIVIPRESSAPRMRRDREMGEFLPLPPGDTLETMKPNKAGQLRTRQVELYGFVRFR